MSQITHLLSINNIWTPRNENIIYLYFFVKLIGPHSAIYNKNRSCLNLKWSVFPNRESKCTRHQASRTLFLYCILEVEFHLRTCTRAQNTQRLSGARTPFPWGIWRAPNNGAHQMAHLNGPHTGTPMGHWIPGFAPIQMDYTAGSTVDGYLIAKICWSLIKGKDDHVSPRHHTLVGPQVSPTTRYSMCTSRIG